VLFRSLLEVASKQYKLSEFLAAKNFKSYDELKRKLEMVLSGGGVVTTAAAMADEEEAEAPVRASKPALVPKTAKPVEDDEDDMSYFQKLANE